MTEARSRKRQRRLVFASLDDDGETLNDVDAPQHESSPGITRGAAKIKQKSLPTMSARRPESYFSIADPNASATHTIGSNKQAVNPTNSISKFFNANASGHSKMLEPNLGIEQRLDRVHSIQGYISEDDIQDVAPASSSAPTLSPKPCPELLQKVAPKASWRGSSSTQDFKLKDIAAKPPSTGSSSTNTATQSWAQRHEPMVVDDLAVNKKKVGEVRDWLREAVSPSSLNRLLVMRGPAGAGKSSTLGVLAKHMNIRLIEFKDPTRYKYSSNDYTPLSSHFADFINRGKFYGSFDLLHGSLDEGQGTGLSSLSFQSLKQGCLLIEDLSSITSSSTWSSSWFIDILLEYLATTGQVCPLVIIFSESTGSDAHRDGCTNARQLLGAQILEHDHVKVIDFNPVASSFLLKTLKRIFQKESRQTSRKHALHPDYLKQLSQVGDFRSAINSLELTHVLNSPGQEVRSGHSANADIELQKSTDSEYLDDRHPEGIDQRESQLGLFHAVGKVVYNKRYDNDTRKSHLTSSAGDVPKFARMRASEVPINELVEDMRPDNGTFVSALHENVVPSCAGATFHISLDGCLDALSESDLLDSNTFLSSRNGGSENSSIELLKSGEFCAQVAVRGILLSLPDPVVRKLAQGTEDASRHKSNDPFKMYYPASLRLFWQREENKILLRQWLQDLYSITSRGNPISLDDYKSISPSSSSDDIHARGADKIAIHLLTMWELIAERLPYTHQIQSFQSDAQKQELARVTGFAGINTPNGSCNSTSTLNQTSTIRRGADCDWSRQTGDKTCHKAASDLDVTKLYLTDDDIEEP